MKRDSHDIIRFIPPEPRDGKGGIIPEQNPDRSYSDFLAAAAEATGQPNPSLTPRELKKQLEDVLGKDVADKLIASSKASKRRGKIKAR